MTARPASLLQLSKATEAVLSKTGCLLIQGQRAFRLSRLEYERLVAAGNDETKEER